MVWNLINMHINFLYSSSLSALVLLFSYVVGQDLAIEIKAA